MLQSCLLTNKRVDARQLKKVSAKATVSPPTSGRRTSGPPDGTTESKSHWDCFSLITLFTLPSFTGTLVKRLEKQVHVDCVLLSSILIKIMADL
jgi:hypothetical protein